MQCEQVQAQLQAYIENDVAENDYQVIYQHLEACDLCCRALEESKCVYDNLQGWHDVQLPPEFAIRLANNRDKNHDQDGDNKAVKGWMQWFPVAACGLMLLLLLFRVEVQLTDAGTLIHFAGSPAQVKTTEMDKRFDEFAREQQQWLEFTGMKMMALQKKNNEGLMQALMAVNGEQNKKYWMQFNHYWQARREQDLHTISNGYRRVLYQQQQDRRLLTSMFDEISDDGVQADHLLKRN